MNAEIIAVGTELLLGDILNTNAQFLSQQLSALGIDVYYQSVVGDNPQRMKQTIHQAIGRSDVVILSGGLGPTDDDLTKEIAAEYFELPLVFHPEIMEEISQYLKRNVPEANRKQAFIPEGAKIIHNPYGTAPGVIIEKDNKTIVLLPGPPRELCPLFLEQVRPYLASKTDCTMVSKVVRLFGIGESVVGETIRDLMENANPTVAPYAKDSEVTLRITAKAESEAEAEVLIQAMFEQVNGRLGKYIYSFGDKEMKQVLAELLLERKLTIAAAESCTAGMFCSMLAEVSGISEALKEGVVTYSNEAKEKYLGVSHETLAEFGAVSPETAREMAVGIRERSGADIGVSITGIAGPGGGTEEKPVGLVYVGVAMKDAVIVKDLHLFGTRQKIRYASVLYAMNEVRQRLLAE